MPTAAISPSMVALLARLDANGPTTVTELARAVKITQPSMTQLVGRAVTDGLVDRSPSTTDRRSVVVSLTEAGLRVLTERRTARSAQMAAALAGLPPHDRAVIAGAIDALDRLVDVT